MYVDFDPDDRRKKSARISEKNFQPAAGNVPKYKFSAT